MNRLLLFAATVSAVCVFGVLRAIPKAPPKIPPIARTWAQQYAPDTLEKVMASAQQRGWTRTGDVITIGGGPVRKVDTEFADASNGSITIWGWEDGNPDTIEGTVETVSYRTGARRLANIQLWQPEWDLTQVQPVWYDVLAVDAGNGGQEAAYHGAPMGPEISLVQGGGQWSCYVPQWRLDNAVWQCVAETWGQAAADAWKNTWLHAGGAALVACAGGGWPSRLRCARDIIGGVFAGELLHNLYYGSRCDRNVIYDQLCETWREHCRAQDGCVQ